MMDSVDNIKMYSELSTSAGVDNETAQYLKKLAVSSYEDAVVIIKLLKNKVKDHDDYVAVYEASLDIVETTMNDLKAGL
jgi:hypothetical protein